MQSLYELFERWLGLHAQPHELTVLQMALRGCVIFLAALVMLRLAHKRFFAGRNAIDVLLTFVLASTMARAVNGNAAFVPTLVVGFVLVYLHRALTWAAARSDLFARLVKGASTPLIEHGQVQERTMRKHDLSQQDLEEDLRINGVAAPDRAQRAVLERNGEISVLKTPRVHTVNVAAGVQTLRIEVG